MTHPSNSKIALMDGNCFFCSCERVFKPDLKKRALVVLSNNDGCVIARSPEAKALGIKMAEPWFKLKHLHHRVVAASSNFTLYSDMSQRMMCTAARFVPSIEVYSIDECFLDFSAAQSPHALATEIRQAVLKETGIPTCIGIAHSKTLAKLANHLAKSQISGQGFFDLSYTTHWRDWRHLLRNIPIQDIWGIGPRLSPKLKALGFQNAWDLANWDPILARKKFSIALSNTILELRGQAIYTLQTQATAQQQIIVSRTFGKALNKYSLLTQAIATFVAIAAQKLRQEHSLTSQLTLFLHSGSYQQPVHQRHSLALHPPTADTRHLTYHAFKLLQDIHEPLASYKKAGIILQSLVPDQVKQLELFPFSDSQGLDTVNPDSLSPIISNDSATKRLSHQTLFHLVDNLNQKFGPHVIRHASMGTHSRQDWFTQQRHRSPNYTTDWAELPIAKT